MDLSIPGHSRILTGYKINMEELKELLMTYVNIDLNQMILSKVRDNRRLPRSGSVRYC